MTADAAIGSYGSAYALVSARSDNGVQIIDITDPYEPIAASAVIHGSGGYNKLQGPRSIATATIGSSTYALVASDTSNGVQIIDITNPYAPTPASSIADNSDGFTKLQGVTSISTTIIGSSAYAIAASRADGGIQFINLNHPRLVYSDNTNPAYAKAGDTLTLEFTVNDTIVSIRPSSQTHLRCPVCNPK